MTDRELRELCNRYFDAIERRDVETVAELYAPGFTFWVNLTGAESSREENLKTLRDGYAVLRRRTYDDRTIDTFGTGFLARYSVNVVQHSGRRGSFRGVRRRAVQGREDHAHRRVPGLEQVPQARGR